MTNPNGQFTSGSANQIANAIQAQSLQNGFTQAIFNAWLAGIDSLKQTAAEIAAGVTIVDYSYAPGVVDRYGTNVSPGTTDMSTAVQSAMKVGGVITFLGATYFFANVNLTQSVMLQGQGESTILLAQQAGTGNAYSSNLFTDTAALASVTFKDLTLHGNQTQPGSQSNTWNVSLVKLTQTGKVRLENVTITGYAASAASIGSDVRTQFYQAVTIYNATEVDLVNVRLVNNYFQGVVVYFTPTSDGACNLQRPKLLNTSGGLAFQTAFEVNGGSVTMTDGFFLNGGRPGPSSPNGDSWVNFNACKSVNCKGNRFVTDDGGGVTFTASVGGATSGTLTVGWPGATGTYNLIFGDGETRTGVTLTNGNTAVSWSGALNAGSITSASATYNSIAINVGQSTFPLNNNVTIEQNDFQSVGQPISCGPGHNVVIRDNTIFHATTAPIFVQSNSTTGFSVFNAVLPAYAVGGPTVPQNLTISGNKIVGIMTGVNSVGVFVSDDTAGGSYGWQNVTLSQNEVSGDPTTAGYNSISYAMRLRDVAHVLIGDHKQLSYGAYGIYSDGNVNDLIIRGNTFIPLNYVNSVASSLDDIYFTGFAPQSLVIEENTFTAYPPGPSTYNVHFAGGDPVGCQIRDNTGMKQSFPVFVGSSTANFVIRNTRGFRTPGAPGSGSAQLNWGIGDVVYTIPATGVAAEYDCTAAGSFATLVGVTVSYTNGNSFCTQTAGTTLAPGMRVSIVKGADGTNPLTACVLFVSGSTVFIDNTFGSTQVSQATTIVNPTFHASAVYST